MRFKADEIVSVLQTEIEQYRGQLDAREVGRVLEVGDGIARVYGLSGVMAGEMVDFKRTGVKGLAFNLEENSVGVIILGQYLEIAEGDEVTTTGQLLRVPVGDALVGRVVDPLGNPLDAKGPVVSNASRALESAFYAVLVFSPVLCAGLIFSSSYKRSQSTAQDFGTNLLGAMVGGIGEYLSLLAGYRFLLVIVGACYLIAIAAISNRKLPSAAPVGR